MLAIHPHIQDTLIAEITSTIGDQAPTYDNFPNLVYPLCVMFETLRFFPPVVCIPKATLNGEQTLLGKYVIPKDMTVFIDALGLHRNEKYWGADVNEFNPSRFDGRGPEGQTVEQDIGDTSSGGFNSKIRIPVRGAFIPFSEGPRSCLGDSLSSKRGTDSRSKVRTSRVCGVFSRAHAEMEDRIAGRGIAGRCLGSPEDEYKFDYTCTGQRDTLGLSKTAVISAIPGLSTIFRLARILLVKCGIRSECISVLWGIYYMEISVS